MDCSTAGFSVFTISQSLLKLMSIELVMHSNPLVLWCPLLLPSIFPSIRVFSRCFSHLVAKLLELWSLLIWKTNKPHWSIFTFISFYYPNSPRTCLLVRSYWNAPMSQPGQMGRPKCLWRIQIEPLKQLLSASNIPGPRVRPVPALRRTQH